MNSQSIWTGHYYAYYPNPGKGVKFIRSAKRVKAVRLDKVREFGNQRSTTYVTVETEAGDTRRVKSRDIICFWEDHEAALADILEREAKRDAEIAARKQEKEDKKATAIREFVKLGFVESDVNFTYNAREVIIDIDVAIAVLQDRDHV